MAFLPEMPIARLELHKTGERCVLEELPVGLQPANLLERPPSSHLRARSLDADVAHDRLQRPAVLRDLGGQLRQGLGEL